MEAEYRSKCPVCGEWIEEGAEIARLTDVDDSIEWCHAECEENA